ncbi:lipid-A-disaccharide synthase N-terminal domain-containing protein [Leptotrichia wadei]|uniref:Lipid A Biosynthesis domain protein n=1 Tax=Leptotrichia wadei (strain F0279) TaxID=888055 RepID=U2RKG2_LEPWF|nr:lipid-A-disaccharide synthase N-terminal domain-containing protein [Leptotrichia wadei]ERK54018.1 lipid A Biosynthesis domain protein [Leptotrichia wadei F0279]
MGKIFIILGLAGQLMFSARFLVQWIASEKRKKSVVPISFWFLSLFGSFLLLIYAIYRKDIVFTLGQLFGFIVYIRNLLIIKNTEKIEKNIKKGKLK